MSDVYVPGRLPTRIRHISGRTVDPSWRQAMDGYWFFDLEVPMSSRVRIQAYWDGHVNVADVDRLGRTANWERFESLALALHFYGWRVP